MHTVSPSRGAYDATILPCHPDLRQRLCADVLSMSALPPKADIAERDPDVRFVPKADILRCGKERRYSITSSARSSNAGGSVKPKIFGSLEIDHTLDLGRKLNRQIVGRGTLQDFVDASALASSSDFAAIRQNRRSMPTTKVLGVEREFRHSAGTAPRALWAGAPLPARSDAIASNTPSRRTSA
jgi:hypothetical protein